jgi:hypothetical protein
MEADQTLVNELLRKIEKARRLARTVRDPKAVEALHQVADELSKELERLAHTAGALRVNRQITALLNAELKETSKQALRSAERAKTPRRSKEPNRSD